MHLQRHRTVMLNKHILRIHIKHDFCWAQSINSRAILAIKNIYMQDFLGVWGNWGTENGGGGTAPQAPPPP